MSDLTVVIARYEENLDWLNRIKKNCNVIIYNKGKENIHTNYKQIKIDNVGREAHTFLYHIVENYDKMSDFTVFLQGDPFEHKKTGLIEYINSGSYIDTPIGHDSHIENSQGSIVSYYLNINKNLNLLFKDPPRHFQFVCGAQNSVSRENITKRSLNFYKFLLMKFDTDPNWPWILERFWNLIFFSDVENHKF